MNTCFQIFLKQFNIIFLFVYYDNLDKILSIHLFLLLNFFSGCQPVTYIFVYNIYFYFFRETGSMERHAEALVTLLESCLNHNLKPSQKEEDPPHAKISSDIISCLFLVSLISYKLLRLIFQT